MKYFKPLMLPERLKERYKQLSKERRIKLVDIAAIGLHYVQSLSESELKKFIISEDKVKGKREIPDNV